MEKKRREIEKGKVENWKLKEKKLQKEERTFFILLLLFFSKPLNEICFGSTKMEIFYREKRHFTRGKKSGKMTLPPLKNIPFTPPGYWNRNIYTRHNNICFFVSCSKENFKINQYKNFQPIRPMRFHFIPRVSHRPLYLLIQIATKNTNCYKYQCFSKSELY